MAFDQEGLDVVGIQEAHGNQERVEVLAREAQGVQGWGSFLLEGSGGGCALFVSPTVRANFTTIAPHVIVDGRVHYLVCEGPMGRLQVFNVHA